MIHATIRRPLLWVAVLFLFAAPLRAQDTDTPAAMPDPSEQTPTVYDNPALVREYQATITPEDLAAHLFTFASDYFEGRETATRGQKLAATYLAGQYRKMGLTPKGSAESMHAFDPAAYFQPVTLYGRRLKQAGITVMHGEHQVAEGMFSAAGPSRLYLAFGNTPEVEGGVVFGGYGIPDADLGYDDLAALKEAGIDFAGKWLLILRDEPLASAERSLLPTEDGTPSTWTTQGFSKLRALFQSGSLPAGILIVGDVGPNAEDVAGRASAQAASIQEGVGSLSLSNEARGGRPFPPIYTITSGLADAILAPSGQSVDSLQARINRTLKPVVLEVADVTVKSTVEQETYETTSENVAAFIEGSDPALKDEVIVVSSHYDHIGINRSAEGDQINNGADDDGSGTVTVLEIAEAFKRAQADGHGPRRSILFLNVTGEEKGLLGSAYYTDTEPLLPLEKTVTNLNIDMIGRHDPTHPEPGQENYVYIIGSNLISQELHDINQRVNEMTGTSLVLHERFNSKDDPNQFYRRSDHWNFGKHNIPFIFFFTGTHDDYHGVDDEPDRIDYDRMATIGRMIFATAWQVANQDAPPAVSGTGFN